MKEDRRMIILFLNNEFLYLFVCEIFLSTILPIILAEITKLVFIRPVTFVFIDNVSWLYKLVFFDNY